MSRSGNSCAKWPLELASKVAPATRSSSVSVSTGTILQRLPFELESDSDGSGRMKSCTLRFWPAALK